MSYGLKKSEWVDILSTIHNKLESIEEKSFKEMNEDFYTLVNYVEQVSDQSGGWLIQLLKRFGNEYFLESGDVCCDAALSLLIKNDLVFKVKHPTEEYNTPDYGITHLGFQVYEQVCYNQRLNTKPMTGIWNTLVG